MALITKQRRKTLRLVMLKLLQRSFQSLPIPKILLLFRTIQIKTAELYFLAVPFVSLFKEVLAFESVDEILTCDHSNETYQARLFKAGLTL